MGSPHIPINIAMSLQLVHWFVHTPAPIVTHNITSCKLVEGFFHIIKDYTPTDIYLLHMMFTNGVLLKCNMHAEQTYMYHQTMCSAC